MGRKYIKYDKDTICNICGRFGAYDFSEGWFPIDYDMFICPECLGQSLRRFYKLEREIKNIYPKNDFHKPKQS